VFQVKAPKS